MSHDADNLRLFTDDDRTAPGDPEPYGQQEEAWEEWMAAESCLLDGLLAGLTLTGAAALLCCGLFFAFHS